MSIEQQVLKSVYEKLEWAIDVLEKQGTREAKDIASNLDDFRSLVSERMMYVGPDDET